MYLESLSLVNFKNLKEVDIQLSPDLNCFIGNNGAGKTNLMDAIYYLSFCKSFLNPIDHMNIRHQEDFFVIQGRYQRSDQEENIYCGLKKGQKKHLRIIFWLTAPCPGGQLGQPCWQPIFRPSILSPCPVQNLSRWKSRPLLWDGRECRAGKL